MNDAGCNASPIAPLAVAAGEGRRRLRVLFAEDNRADVELNRRALLQAGFEVEGEATDRLERFSELVAQQDYDVILADFGLPGWNGMDALEVLDAHRKRVPLILVTGSLGDETAVQCIKAGACDYVLKDNLARLPHAVKRALQEAAVYREREQAQEELRRYAAELERSNRELQDFASIASHDLQEPLRKIIAFGDRLADHAASSLDESGHDYLRRMQNAAGRMSSLIEALLLYSRVTTRAEAFQPVDLALLMFEVLVDLEVRIQETQARVQVGPLPSLLADRTQMRQLLQNLLSNALKFCRPGVPPLVEVDSRRLPGGDWEVTIRDNGVGFEETYLDRIFRPFQRLHARSEFEGTGMGLAICRKIVARHGGTITARSQPGQGSTFIVTLPAAPNTQETPCRKTDSEELCSSPKMMTTTSC